MKTWYIKILDENSKNKKRIEIKYIPLLDVIKLTGQYCVNGIWEEMITQQITADFTPEKLNEVIVSISDDIDAKMQRYDDLNMAFKLIEEIEIKENIK